MPVLPVVHTKTGSGTKPYDLYSATTRTPISPAVNPMLYKQNPMCARNNCAAAGGRMNPISKPVTMARGTVTTGRSVVLNRTSETMGASATPKNAVLMCVANGSS